MLSATSSLIGNATIKLFDLWREKGNLCFVGLAPSGTGKTPACNIGWVSPIISHLEPRIGQNILVDETSSNGLFNHIVSFHKGVAGESVPILCINEGYTFLNKLTSTSKSAAQTSLTMERMCKLYGGDYWYSMKGSKGKRVGVPSARMSMVTYTTPLLDRNLAKSRQLPQWACKENPHFVPGSLQSGNGRNGAMFGTNPGKFTERIRNHLWTYFYRTPLGKSEGVHLKRVCPWAVYEVLQSSVGAFNPECNTKTSKNALRLALNLHVLWHRLEKALNQLTGSTPNVVLESTMNTR